MYNRKKWSNRMLYLHFPGHRAILQSTGKNQRLTRRNETKVISTNKKIPKLVGLEIFYIVFISKS